MVPESVDVSYQKICCIWWEKKNSDFISLAPARWLFTWNFFFIINWLSSHVRTFAEAHNFYHLFIFTLTLRVHIDVDGESVLLPCFVCFHHKVYDVNKFVAHVAHARRSVDTLIECLIACIFFAWWIWVKRILCCHKWTKKKKKKKQQQRQMNERMWTAKGTAENLRCILNLH